MTGDEAVQFNYTYVLNTPQSNASGFISRRINYDGSASPPILEATFEDDKYVSVDLLILDIFIDDNLNISVKYKVDFYRGEETIFSERNAAVSDNVK